MCDDVGNDDLTTVTTVKSFSGVYFDIPVCHLQSLNIHGSSEGRLKQNVRSESLTTYFNTKTLV